jgi:hypothetical protein
MKSTLKYYGGRGTFKSTEPGLSPGNVFLSHGKVLMWNQFQNSYSMFRAARKPRRDSTIWEAAEPTQERIVLRADRFRCNQRGWSARLEVPP